MEVGMPLRLPALGMSSFSAGSIGRVKVFT